MGGSFRRSIKAGPFRVNLSKSGLGVSGGVRGARVSVGPRGTTLYGGWGPFRYKKRLSGAAQGTASQPGGCCGCLGCLAFVLLGLFGLALVGTCNLSDHRVEESPRSGMPRPDSGARTTGASRPLVAENVAKSPLVEQEETNKAVQRTRSLRVDTDLPCPGVRLWQEGASRCRRLARLANVQGDAVDLKDLDGSSRTLPLAQLSRADQAYVQESLVLKRIVARSLIVTAGDILSVREVETGRTYKVRLAEIDSPEAEQASGAMARQELAKRVAQQEITVTWRCLDGCGRLLGHVYIGDKWINRELVEDGLAWHTPEFSESQDLAVTQEQARKAGRGLWGKANPQPPWEYRAARGLSMSDPDEQILRNELAFLSDFPEISWYEAEGHEVYVGLKAIPGDLDLLLQFAASKGNASIGSVVRVWAVGAAEKHWRPGRGSTELGMATGEETTASDATSNSP